MMRWVHIDFWFWDCNYRTDKYLTPQQQKQFEQLLANFIIQCRPYINRKFYLYEDIPHCFLALELKNIFYLPKINQLIQKINKPEFIYKMIINTTAGDDRANGEGFLNILNAFTDFYLFKKDNRITHIIHCCMEFMTQSRQKECEFYQNMAIDYQVVKVKNRKLVYGYKRFTPEIRKKIKKFIDDYDLRKQK